jgi:hypothetical protein
MSIYQVYNLKKPTFLSLRKKAYTCVYDSDSDGD